MGAAIQCESDLVAHRSRPHQFLQEGADGYPIIVDIPKIEEGAKARLERVDIPNASRVVAVGDPAYEITQYAEKNAVDLIMMPTHGYGTFRSLLLGSTAAKVLHDAHCPVWTSAHIEQIPVEARTDIHNVLCAIELSAESVGLIRSATELAQAWQAKLRLVHAVPVDDTRPEKYLEGDFSAALVEQAARKSLIFNEMPALTWKRLSKAAAPPTWSGMRHGNSARIWWLRGEGSCMTPSAGCAQIRTRSSAIPRVQSSARSP